LLLSGWVVQEKNAINLSAARGITADLEAALEQFATIAEDLRR
jgi:hypothetical protein